MARIKVAAAAAATVYYSFPVKNRKRGTTDTIEGATSSARTRCRASTATATSTAASSTPATRWLLYALRRYQTGIPSRGIPATGQVMMGRTPDRALDMCCRSAFQG